MRKYILGTKTRTLSSLKDYKLYSDACHKIFFLIKTKHGFLGSGYPWGNIICEKTLAVYLRLKFRKKL